MSENADEWRFRGISQPRYTQAPNVLFDELLEPGRLSEAELRVVLYIVRRTFGWSKDSDSISIRQMTDGIVRQDGVRVDWGTGVKRAAVCRALISLEHKGVIVIERNRSEARGDETNIYRLRWEGEALSIPESPKETLPVSLRDSPPGDPNETPPVIPTRPGGVSQRDPQKRTKQKTIIQNEDSNINALGKNEEPTYSPWIAGIVEDYSREFGEPSSAPMNISRALRMWQEAEVGEAAFVELLRKSRDLTRTAQGAQGNGKINRKMAYFFSVVADQAGGG